MLNDRGARGPARGWAGLLFPAFIAACVALGCTANPVAGPTPPSLGTIRVTVATSGPPNDTTGWTVRVDTGIARDISTHGASVFDSLAPGSHAVSLAGFSANCTVSGADPRAVVVTAGDTSGVGFGVQCTAPPPPADVAGTWDWTEHFLDPGTGFECTDTGTYVFVAVGTGFVGRSDQSGQCVDPEFGQFANDRFDDSVTAGTVAGNQVQFQVGFAPDSCIYVGTVTGNQVVGTATCGTSTATWSGQRGLGISISVNPSAVPLPPNVSIPLQTTVLNSLGNPAFDRPLTWSSDDPTIASVDTAGNITSNHAGFTIIRVRGGGGEGTSMVTVGGVSVADAPGDTVASGTDPAFDIASVSAVSDSTMLTVAVQFTGPLLTTLYGYVDLDVDQNPGTGTVPYIDLFRTDSGASDLGDEFFLDLSDGSLYQTSDGSWLGYMSMWFDSRTNTLLGEIPFSLLRSNRVNLAAIVGNEFGATDWAPNTGHLSLGPSYGTTMMAARRSATAPVARSWRRSGSPGRVSPLAGHSTVRRGGKAKVFRRR